LVPVGEGVGGDCAWSDKAKTALDRKAASSAVAWPTTLRKTLLICRIVIFLHSSNLLSTFSGKLRRKSQFYFDVITATQSGDAAFENKEAAKTAPAIRAENLGRVSFLSEWLLEQ
jgi:hypothetical protein